jgi:hypothetical protein
MVRRYLKEEFPTIASAEEAYGISYFGEKVKYRLFIAKYSIITSCNYYSYHTVGIKCGPECTIYSTCCVWSYYICKISTAWIFSLT